MTDELPRRRRSLDSLKKEAKRWLDALRANAADARARLERALPNVSATPTLRDVQHALAREHGFSGWAALKQALASDRDGGGAGRLAQYETMAEALLEAYRTGTPEAMERHYRHTWHRRSWQAMRTYVQLDLGKRPNGPDNDVEITLDDARYLVANRARVRGLGCTERVRSIGDGGAARRREAGAARQSRSARGIPADRKLARVGCGDPAARNAPITGLRSLSYYFNSYTTITDRTPELLSGMDSLERITFDTCHGLTNAGVARLARLPRLRELRVSGKRVTSEVVDAFSPRVSVLYGP